MQVAKLITPQSVIYKPQCSIEISVYSCITTEITSKIRKAKKIRERESDRNSLAPKKKEKKNLELPNCVQLKTEPNLTNRPSHAERKLKMVIVKKNRTFR